MITLISLIIASAYRFARALRFISGRKLRQGDLAGSFEIFHEFWNLRLSHWLVIATLVLLGTMSMGVQAVESVLALLSTDYLPSFNMVLVNGDASSEWAATESEAATSMIAKWNSHNSTPQPCNFSNGAHGTYTQSLSLKTSSTTVGGYWWFTMTNSGCGQTSTYDWAGYASQRNLPVLRCPAHASPQDGTCVCDDRYGPAGDRTSCSLRGSGSVTPTTIIVQNYTLRINGNDTGQFSSIADACQYYILGLQQDINSTYKLILCATSSTVPSVFVDSRVKTWPNGLSTHSAFILPWSTTTMAGCGANSTIEGAGCLCNSGYIPDQSGLACIPYKDRWHDKPRDPLACKKNPAEGHPIFPLIGSKALSESLGSWSVGSKPVVIGYDTRRKVPANDATLVFSALPATSFGELWASNLHKSLMLQIDGSPSSAVQASRGAGAWVSFIKTGTSYLPDTDVVDRLVQVSGGWRYYDALERAEETYDASGKLLGVVYTSGASLTYAYSDANTSAAIAPAPGLLLSVQDQLGHTVQFQYEQPAGVAAPRINQITDPSGQPIAVRYDAANNLAQLDWPDGKSRQYLYERSDIPWALTGIVDENASRLATYGYDAQGRANDTQWAGGVDHYSASYSSPPAWNIIESYDSAANINWRDHYWQLPQGTTVTGPNGSVTSFGATLVQGMPSLTSQSQPAGAGCNASTSNQSLDANGNIVSRDDFNGSRVCSAYDQGRNLETSRVEGLTGGASGTDCGTVTPANAVLPTGSRKTSTVWHPDWRLAVQVAEPGRLTTSIYNGQPDPTAGGAVASCAPSGAVLPDGKPIAVLCKQVQQATTDTDGHLGFAAALQTGVASRVSNWTYNQYGQVLTERDPLGHTTTYAYYADSSFTGADPNAVGHTMGDLQTVTNAVGQATTYDLYDKNGNLLQSTDPNGVVTANSYDPRQRLLSTTVGGHKTSYTYDAVGQLLQVSQPDGSWIGYEYDAAHRKTATKDSLGNRIELTLDNAGNVTAQNVLDPSGALARTLSQTFDALNRVQQTTGAQ